MVCQYAGVACETYLADEALGFVCGRDRAAVQDRGQGAVRVLLVAELGDEVVLTPEHRVDSGLDLA